ncbi:hypothetical protein HRI_000750200 [Hibiscus trionum]|uniref:Uncharacterized protein n=1 Tax=Hibiscus trionum TaxID=183268 RepID=A0A9W7H4A6_HIBTR|nr:hypothetical protein HRI_000750200 [Hibiscus trionum]
MKIEKTIPSILKYFLIFCLLLLLFVSLQNGRSQPLLAIISTVTTTANHPSPPSSAVASSDDLNIRRGYTTYEATTPTSNANLTKP